MAIDAGASAIDRPSMSLGNTTVSKENPANATGLIFYIAIYCPSFAATGIKVAAFSASGNDLTTRGWTTLGDANVGLTEYDTPEDFTPFEIRAGDYIGIYTAISTGVDITLAGQGCWLLEYDSIPCSSQTFIWVPDRTLSLYATGYQLGQLNVGDAWKDVQNIQINIGDSWKSLDDGKQNIGDVWKSILH